MLPTGVCEMKEERIVLGPTLDIDLFLDRGGAKGVEDLEEEARRLFSDCAPLVRPKALVCDVEVTVVDDLSVMIENERFESRCLAANLAGLDRAFVYVATCGAELDRVVVGGDGLERYWVDVIKEFALDAAIHEVNRRVSGYFGSDGVASMNPGSADADVWPLSQQRPLFRLLGDTKKTVGVTLTDSLLMVPNKTVSGVLFPSRAGWVNCQMCTRKGCVGRRAAYVGR